MTELIFGIGHIARVGKDEAAAYLVEHHGFTRLSTADMIREFAWELNPMVNAVMSSDQPYHIEPVRYREAVEWHGADAAKDKEPEVRRIQQQVGQIMRRLYGDDFWSYRLEEKIESTRGNIVIPDVRFPNEVEMIEYYGGFTIRMDRPGFKPLDHITDQALTDYEHWDFIINNSSDIKALHRTLDLVVEKASSGDVFGTVKYETWSLEPS